MSYILDALKKSDQERQQGTSPNLLSKHGSIPSGMVFSPFKRHRAFWLIPGGILFFLTGLGIFFFQYQGQFDQRDSTKVTDTAIPSDKLPPPVQVLVKEKIQVLEPIITTEATVSDLPKTFEREAPQTSLPFLNDLPAAMRAKLPALKFAGHTYSENPYQRMIIINGKILREGDMIDSNTRLAEINWEGVTIDFSGIRFQVKTN
ncbi:MAG: general secretion pathway protein GspB [Desulfobulbaceae bacterium]|nr:general secretion pathway protein GspB [Desulfobulbaceae bacterium]